MTTSLSSPTIPLLALNNIRFQRAERVILDHLHWSVFPKQIAAVVGPNGCGKSTLLRLIAGYLWPAAGSVALLGHTLGEFPLATLRQRISIVEASSIYPFDDDMTALDVVCSGFFSALSIHYNSPTDEQWQRSQQTLAAVMLGDCSGQPYGTLSTGQRMRVLIARALVRQPELILLDEPTAGLDLPARETVLATLRRLHDTPSCPGIVIVTHHLEELLPDTSNVLLLDPRGSTIAQGHPDDVLTNDHLSEAFRCPIHVLKTHGRYHAHVDPQTWSDLVS